MTAEIKRDPAKLAEFLSKRIKEKNYTGVSVCITGPDGVMFEHNHGVTSLKTNNPVNSDTVFGLASMSKSFTTLSLCILAAEGRINLDDPVSKFLPKFHIPGIPDELVTVRQMMMNRSGLPPMEPLEWSIVMNTPNRNSEYDKKLKASAPNSMSTIDQVVEYVSEGRYQPLGEPGEYMSYSNEGYAILSSIVDIASGKTLEEFLDERVFGPLGMTRSILDVDCSKAKERAGDGNVISLFERDAEGNLVEDDNWSILPPFRGCACIKSTSKDASRYYSMLSNGGKFGGKQIIPAEAVEILIGKAHPLRRKPFYAMALKKWSLDGYMICDHGGALHGVSTHGGVVEGGYGVAALCNDGEVDMEWAFWACCDWLLGKEIGTDHTWTKPCGKKFSGQAMLAGDYVGHEGVVSHCLVYVDPTGQLMCNQNGNLYRLEWCEATVFAVYSTITGNRVNTFRFYISDGKSWAVKCGSRIFRRA